MRGMSEEEGGNRVSSEKDRDSYLNNKQMHPSTRRVERTLQSSCVHLGKRPKRELFPSPTCPESHKS